MGSGHVLYIYIQYSTSVSPEVCEGILLCGQKMDGQNLLRSEEGGTFATITYCHPATKFTYRKSPTRNNRKEKHFPIIKMMNVKTCICCKAATVASVHEISLEDSSVLKRMVQLNLTTKAELYIT